MSDHQMPANRQAVLNAITILLDNPEFNDDQVFNSIVGLIRPLSNSPQREAALIEQVSRGANESIAKPKSRKPSGDSNYVVGLLPRLKDFIHPDADYIDRDIGLSCEEIRQSLFDRDAIRYSITAENIQRVLVANQRHFKKLPNGNWRAKSSMKGFGEHSTKRLIESKKQSNPDP